MDNMALFKLSINAHSNVSTHGVMMWRPCTEEGHWGQEQSTRCENKEQELQRTREKSATPAVSECPQLAEGALGSKQQAWKAIQEALSSQGHAN